MLYRIKEIFEVDHGCEGMMEKETPKVNVIFQDKDGQEHLRKVEDEYLYANDIDEGDIVNEKIEKKFYFESCKDYYLEVKTVDGEKAGFICAKGNKIIEESAAEPTEESAKKSVDTDWINAEAADIVGTQLTILSQFSGLGLDSFLKKEYHKRVKKWGEKSREDSKCYFE